jgi:hypothetical protein
MQQHGRVEEEIRNNICHDLDHAFRYHESTFPRQLEKHLRN